MLSCNRFSPLILQLIIIFILNSLISSSTTTTNSTDKILYDIYPFVRVYTNGTVQRFFGQDFVPPSTDPTTGVHSKDVQISKRSNLSARIFIPNNPTRKIPLLVYFHGGGFFSESPFSPTYHKHLNLLVSKANVIAVSVNYRLAPENPLPIAYEDSWVALKWVFSHLKNGEEIWLKKFADFGRVYLGGDSAGGNIASQMGIRVGSEKVDPGILIKGVFLNCPYFWGKRAVGNELANAYAADLMEKIWVHACPRSSGLDDPLVNPGMDPGLRKMGCKRVLVYVAGKDVLRFRGWYYKEVLERSGWSGVVSVVEVEGEDHVFNLINPSSSKAIVMMERLAYFLNH